MVSDRCKWFFQQYRMTFPVRQRMINRIIPIMNQHRLAVHSLSVERICIKLEITRFNLRKVP